MAKKITTPESPIITKLPLPNSDNALVIDLPDGQKLVVGKMATGTVIEVATWRGTGRPDSRTTRLMLGVTSQEASAAALVDSGASGAEATRNRVDKLKAFWHQNFKKSLELLKMVRAIKSVKIKKNKNSESAPPIKSIYTPSTEPSEDVQAWLDSISAKSEKKAESKAIIISGKKKSNVPRQAAPRKSTSKKESR